MKNQNSNWEDIRFNLVCDRWGDYVTTNTYSVANIYRIDPRLEYHYLTEKEYEQLQEKEKINELKLKRKKKKQLKVIWKIANNHFTEIQLFVLIGILQNKSWVEIAKERGCSPQAIQQVFEGNSRGQGGIIRKIQKLAKNYL